jgi:glutamyl-tRNA synthetase
MRLRFAPSPTGFLHIGGARTALFNWLYARKNNGVFILRIEDTDLERSKKEHEEQICQDLDWLGLNWDEGPNVGGDFGPYRQSERSQTYQQYIQQLLEKGLAYRCTCTPDDLDKMRSEQASKGELQKYDSRCRNKKLGADCGVHVVRFAMPLEGTTLVADQIKGDTIFDNTQLDDFILRRSDGGPTYNFVVVCDDFDMGVTHVVRGDDHLNNTPKQVNLYKALGATVPKFAHLPLILGPDGKRLSKRHGATAVGSYKEMGIIKEALFNYLTRLGWAHEDEEVFDAQRATSLFDISGVAKSGAKWDKEKLLWINQQWIMKLELSDLCQRALPFFEKEGVLIDENNRKMYEFVVQIMQQRAQTLVQLAQNAAFFFVSEDMFSFVPEDAQKAFGERNQKWFLEIKDVFEQVNDWNTEGIKTPLLSWVKEKSTESKAQGGKKVKAGQVMFPLRIALCGGKAGPDLYDTMVALGKDKVLSRLVLAANYKQEATS